MTLEYLVKIGTILFIIFVLIYGFYYAYLTYKNTDMFKDVGPFNYYWLDPAAYNPNIEGPYFNSGIYSVPGISNYNMGNFSNPDNNVYMPYESMVPAIDVLRANKELNYSDYYKQYLNKNITPFTSRMY